MSITRFAQQIEHLLFTGAIEGEAVLTLYNLLKSYEQGLIRAEDLQAEINAFDREQQYWLEPHEDDRPVTHE
jgi:hypothetical protein